VTWTADSREVVYSTRRESGGAGIWRISLDGGQPRWLSNALQFAGNPHITPVGGRLAYTESRTDSNLYRFTRSSSETFDSGKRIVSSSREDHSPAYSPDGERVVFVSNRTGYSELWTSRDDGSNQFQLTDLKAFAGTPRWSPDGKLIAFDFLMGGNFEIFVISPDGGAARRLTDNSAHDSKPSFSPDSSTIYFTSNRTGAYELWAMNREGSDLRQVTKTGAREGIPAPDGRSIYLTHGPSGSAIWQLPLDGGAAQPVEALSEYKRVGRAWGAIKSGIYFLSAEPEGSEQTIRFYDFATRHVVPLRKWQSNGMWTGPVVAMSPDGKALLVAQTDHQVNDLMLIEKFR
jgi:Tol biopolymer transport system component